MLVLIAAQLLDWSLGYDTLRRANGGLLAVALVLFAINWALRALRFAMLLDGSTAGRYPLLLGITTVHGMFTYLMPMKSGELSYLLLTSRFLNVPVAESTATLITARLLDFVVIAFLLPVALLQLDQALPQWLAHVCTIFGVSVVAAAAALLLYVRKSTWEISQDPGQRWRDRVAKVLHDTLQCLKQIDARRQYLLLWLISLSIWLCILMQYYFITASLGFEPRFVHMVVISVILIPLTLMPVQGIANIGTHEAAWVIALALFGYDFDAAMTLAVTSHVLVFLMFLVMGLAGYVLLTSIRRRGASGA